MTKQEIDQLFLLALSNADENAYRELFRLFWNPIYKTIFQHVKSKEQAEDLCQEVFTKVYHRRKQLSEVRDLQNYIFIIARNCSIDFLRKKSPKAEHVESLNDFFQDSQPQPDKILEYKQLDSTMQMAINELPQQLKEVFIKSRIEGLSHEEIAKQVGISVFSSKTYIVRALQRIRKSLQQHEALRTLILMSLLWSQYR
ncbi:MULTISPECIES: RNA polymerase sigma factor [unclassified Sphingobacterium]|uniref:RNA polymerase sigma factor n=1 Tax=unclassified Sphingobacterium TaxID=2609468 RepID=UPI00265CB4B6|nr:MULTISPECIES: sigma-70 family RNA polymerase sigma factor [unclassified Sphingobacterium]WKK57187.1 sigma-70 family RNA polymerase sigma factor [Sphingobacterium sp. BN32]